MDVGDDRKQPRRDGDQQRKRTARGHRRAVSIGDDAAFVDRWYVNDVFVGFVVSTVEHFRWRSVRDGSHRTVPVATDDVIEVAAVNNAAALVAGWNVDDVTTSRRQFCFHSGI